jgi:hypothetical protein
VQAQRSPVVLYAKSSKASAHGKGIKVLEAKTQKLADFQVTGGFDVPDHPPGNPSPCGTANQYLSGQGFRCSFSPVDRCDESKIMRV